MANPGKNKLLRFGRLYLEGADISGDGRSIGTLRGMMGEADMTAWDQQLRTAIADAVQDVGIDGLQVFLNDNAATVWQALKTPSATAEAVVTYLQGGLAVPAIGDPAYLMAAVNLNSATMFDGPPAILQASLLPLSGSINAFPWGKCLLPLTNLTTTGNQASVDTVNGGLLGCIASLHIISSASGDFAFKIQDSANDVDWADLVSFSMDGSTAGAEMVQTSGTVDRYVRFVATRTGGSCYAVSALAIKIL